jgi:branched-chain amino acid aminotransferase
MKPKIYINGKILPEGKAVVSVFDRGLNYGDGLFETIKSYNGKPAFLNGHLRRLKSGAALIGISPSLLKPFERDIKLGILEKLLEANGLEKGEAYIKIIITRGVDKGGHAPVKGINPTVIIIAKELDCGKIARLQKKGVKAVLVKGVLSAMPELKTLNYLPNVIAKIEAVKRGAFEGLFVNKRGFITEGSSTNIFIFSKGVLITPLVRETALPGVTRKTIIELAIKAGLKVRQCHITERSLFECGEAFLTNSISEVLPLVKVGSKTLATGKPGAVTRLMQKRFCHIRSAPIVAPHVAP